MGDVTKLIVTLVQNTDGWVVVAVLVLYLGFRSYLVFVEDRKMRLIQHTIVQDMTEIKRGIQGVDRSLQNLVAAMNLFLGGGGR